MTQARDNVCNLAMMPMTGEVLSLLLAKTRPESDTHKKLEACAN